MKFIFNTLLISSLIISCGDGSSDSSPKFKGQQNLEERWPGQGSYSYELDDNGCKTKQNFSKEFEYCRALTDSDLNNGCALKTRKMLYTTNCGSDFAEINISAIFVSGWDKRLQEDCSTHDSNQLYTELELCNFLKNEELHVNCHWDDRLERFEQRECSGDFSIEPTRVIVSTPEPPTPTPTPNPNPPQQTTLLDELVMEFSARNIKLEVVYDNSMPFPGSPSFKEKLKLFLPRLDKHKEDFFNNDVQLKEITISTYSAFRSKHNSLSIGVDLESQDIYDYLKLMSKQVVLEKTMSVSLALGINIYGSEAPPKTQSYREKIDFFESYKNRIKNVNSALKIIDISTSNYYSDYNRELTLDEENFEYDIEKYISMLEISNPIYKYLDKKNINIDLPASLSNNLPLYTDTFRKVTNLMSSIKTLAESNGLKEINISPTNNTMRYYSGIKVLNLVLTPSNYNNYKQVLSNFSDAYKIFADNGIKYDNFTNEVGANQESAFKRVQRFKNLISRKASRIKEFSYARKSEFRYDTLYIGYEDNDSDLRQALNSIP